MFREKPGIEIEKCDALTKEILDLFDRQVSKEVLEGPTMSALEFLWNQSNLLAELVEQRPESQGRSGREYFDGVRLGELAYEIALRLRERGFQSVEEIALRIRLKALTRVQGHYYHIIGPAMTEHAQILANLERFSEAAKSYDSVISDFSWLLDEVEDSDGELDEEDKVSLESLRTALSYRLEFGELSHDAAADLKLKQSRVAKLLSNP